MTLSTKNPRVKGLQRDKLILSYIESFVALDIHQIYSLLFSEIKCGIRKAQERLLKLYRREKISRCLTENGFAYFYSQPGMLEHLIGTNWVRIYLQKDLKDWETEHSFEYEPDYKFLRADGFMAIKNKVTGKFRFIFIENDRATNKFDKVQKYNRIYSEDLYTDKWWVRLTNRFPQVLIATTGPRRKKTIEQEIERNNTNGLEFKVVILDDLIKEVKNNEIC